jgi:hypothetical protein
LNEQLCTTANPRGPCLLWVKSGHDGANLPRPLHPESGHCRAAPGCALCAIKRAAAAQRKSVLFNHFVGEHKQVVWQFDSEHAGGFEIDDEVEFRRLLNRDVAGLGPA